MTRDQDLNWKGLQLYPPLPCPFAKYIHFPALSCDPVLPGSWWVLSWSHWQQKRRLLSPEWARWKGWSGSLDQSSTLLTLKLRIFLAVYSQTAWFPRLCRVCAILKRHSMPHPPPHPQAQHTPFPSPFSHSDLFFPLNVSLSMCGVIAPHGFSWTNLKKWAWS